MNHLKKPIFALLVAFLILFSVGCAAHKKNVRPGLLEGPGYTKVENNLHQIDGPPPGKGKAYRLYRSGAPSKETFAEWCSKYEIERVIVMAGDAEEHELAFQAEGACPNIKVIYNTKQSHAEPVSGGFLKWFDTEIEKAKRDQVGLLFRCKTGSHRAGRIAAYYQMKYQGLTADEAIAVMTHNGMLMPLFNTVLVPQVRALYDYINNRPCSQKKKFCVEINSDKWVEHGPGETRLFLRRPWPVNYAPSASFRLQTVSCPGFQHLGLGFEFVFKTLD